MNNRKKGALNILVGLLSQVIVIILGLVIPRLFLVHFGSETNGFINSITQIFSYFTLFEAGVGTATLQALYGPAAKEDHQSISEILAATACFYKKTGIAYIAAVILLAVIYPACVVSDISGPTMSLVILFQGFGGAIAYLFQGKYLMLLRAEGKNYILSVVTTLVNVSISACRVIFICLGFPLVVVQSSFFAVNVAQMLFYQWYLKKNYAWIDRGATPNFAAIAQKNSVIVHQFSTLVFNNTDVILLTFLANDLKVVSVYTIYNMVVSMCRVLLNQVCEGVTFRLGQLYHTNREKYLTYHNYFELFNMVVGFCIFSIVYLLIVPFIRLYTEGVTDIDYLMPYLPFLFVMVQLITTSRQTASYLIDFAGHFKKTQWRSLLETCLNLGISVIFIIKYGIYGVLIGTIAALLYRANDMVIYSYRHIIGEKPWRIYRRWMVNYAVFFLICVASLRVDLYAGSYPEWVLEAIVVSVCVALLYGAVNLLFEFRTIREMIKLIRK